MKANVDFVAWALRTQPYCITFPSLGVLLSKMRIIIFVVEGLGNMGINKDRLD